MNLGLFFDTETTGIPDFKAPSESEHQPHIVQLAALLVDLDTRQIVQMMDVIVWPGGWTITQETIDIHGITQEMALEVGVSEKLAVEMFLQLWKHCPRMAYNTTFDNRIIRIALKRYFDESVINAWHEGAQGVEWQCQMIAARKIMGGKQPTLAEAYKHFTGNELEHAHSAIADTKACMDVYFAIKNAQEKVA